MTSLETTNPRAFAIWFKDLHVWSVGSFFRLDWRWPTEYIKPLSSALTRKRVEVDRSQHSFDSLCLVTLHFDGTMEERDLGDKDDFKGKLFFAASGDVIYSRIDVRNGAIGVVPKEMPLVAVSSEYPVYQVNTSVALPQYIQLVFRTGAFRRAINAMISGTSGRKRVQPEQIELLEVPLPPPKVQRAIIARWQEAQDRMTALRDSLQKVIADLNAKLYERYHATCRQDVLAQRSLAVMWEDLARWDVKTARAAAFRNANPTFHPLGKFAEEATELVRPWDQPERDWPVYGVDNKDGVFFSHYQKGKEFNAAYKRIHKDWFFHNPTRSSVGSLGIVPEVPEDAITSPEYQVWRIRKGLKPGYVATLINTPFFIELIQFHRTGAVKQRLYVENLLEIPIPEFPGAFQEKIASDRAQALSRVAKAREESESAHKEMEELILGTKKLEDLSNA
jgi:hypothetical protein